MHSFQVITIKTVYLNMSRELSGWPLMIPKISVILKYLEMKWFLFLKDGKKDLKI